MEHYVYRITNIKIKKHYYGVRTSKYTTAEEDLGIKYFSSSLDEELIKDQKQNPEDYRYKIIKKFKTRYLAEMFENKIHKRFNVAISENFYNRCNANEYGFNVLGKMTVKDKNGKLIGSVDINHPKVLSGEWVHHSKGKKLTKEEAMKKGSPGEKNHKYSGYSDDELLNIARTYILEKGRLDKEFYLKFPKFPKSFSKCRFQEIDDMSGVKRFKKAYKIKFGKNILNI